MTVPARRRGQASGVRFRNVGLASGTAYGAQGQRMGAMAVDWADWDDTYRFMSDHNARYIQSNLGQSSIAAMQMDVVMMLDRCREVEESLQPVGVEGSRHPLHGRVAAPAHHLNRLLAR